MGREDPPIELQFTMADQWSRLLFTALSRRYGLEPFRYRRQRRTTVMLRVPKGFVDKILWPEFTELDELLRLYLQEVTLKLVRETIHADTSEAEEVEGGALIAG
jgi:hypothetical protein